MTKINALADVLVIGSGPAGLAAAAHLGEAGLRVVGVSPTLGAAWPNTYGVWVDEVAPLGYEPFLAQVWHETVGSFGQGEVALGRSYGRFDNSRLQQHLWARCEAVKVVWQRGLVAAVTHQAEGSSLTTSDGQTYSARLILDGSGHFSKLVTRPPGTPAFQTAYGVLGRFSAPPVKPGQLLLMDFQDDFLTPAERNAPTFLYAMDLGDGLFFAEETSLAHRPGLELEALKTRLERRLTHYGVHITEVLEEEHCRFPMNVPLPKLTQRVVGFGGAASMVHPASGYLIASVLRRAPELAQAVARTLGANTLPQQAAEAAWETLWPRERVRARELYLFGLEALLGLDSTQLKGFFGAFFKLAPDLWQGYLSGTHGAGGVARTMTAMFKHAPNNVRLPLIRTSFGPTRTHLIRALR